MDIIQKFSGKYLFLANHYSQRFCYKGRTFKSCLSCYYWLLEKDEYTKDIITELPPYKLLTKFEFDQLDYDKFNDRDSIMMELLRVKFNDVRLKSLLEFTRGKLLVNVVEYQDTYWGIYNGQGLNKLGKFLMEIRDGRI